MDNGLSTFLFNRMRIPQLDRYLDLAAYRHKLLAGNVANVATPGYQAQDLDFAGEYEKLNKSDRPFSLSVTHPNHLPVGQDRFSPKVHRTKVESSAMNSVDIDREVASMAQNELRFTVAARLLQRKFDGMRSAIQSK